MFNGLAFQGRLGIAPESINPRKNEEEQERLPASLSFPWLTYQIAISKSLSEPDIFMILFLAWQQKYGRWIAKLWIISLDHKLGWTSL